MKEQNIWVKKVKRGEIDSDEGALGDDEAYAKGDEHEGDGHETDATVGASSSATFNTKCSFEAILRRFDNLNTSLDSMEHKQDAFIVQAQQL